MMNKGITKRRRAGALQNLLPAAAECFVELHQGQKLISACLGQIQLGIE
jgi:hypothetical protein